MRKYENVRIEDLKPYANNARTHSKTQVAKIAKSIKEFGFINPVIIDGDLNVIAGHGRILAAKELGYTELPCLFVEDLTEAQKRAYILADNKLALDAGWDEDILRQELIALDEMDFDLDFTGFSEIEIEELLADDTAAVEDEADLEPPEEPISQLGNIWDLGGHRLMCGDSTSAESVKKLLGGVQADMLITDPPYNIDYEGKTKKKLKIINDKMDDDKFFWFLVDAFAAAKENMKGGAVFYIWHADTEGYNFRRACREVGWQVRETLIWDKGTMTLGRQDYQWQHEPCLYGWSDGAGHAWYGDRKQTTVIQMPKPQKSELHPTMKPIGLFDYQIRNSSKTGDVILDLFGGSGTTVMACEQNGRKACVMELDPRYCDVIIKRWEDFTGKKAVLVE